MRRPWTRRLTLLACCCALLALAAGTLGAAARSAMDVDMRVVAVGDAGASGRGKALPLRADLLGARWRGPADAIELRARDAGGRWSQWVVLEAGDDAPDPGSAEARRARRVTSQRVASNPVWVGAAAQVQVRRHGRGVARDVQVVAINATGSATRSERVATRLRRGADWVLGAVESRADAQPYAPGIRSRASWGASAPAAEPTVARAGVVGSVVHHTAGTNRYTCAQVPALLRGIQRYHMRSNGWNDIGYNYLIDACGGVWEGRAGGITKAVIGAHTSGFNTSTTGIALIGTHAAVRPSAKARLALTRLLAWRLDVAHVKPTSKALLVARSSDKFPAGSTVSVRAVSGHRDLFPTSCPGALAYRDLDLIAGAAWRMGGPKVANVARSFTLANPADPLDASVAQVRVRAVASSADMTLTARLERISTGEVLDTATVNGIAISRTWIAPAGARVPSWDIRVEVDGDRAGVKARAAAFELDPVDQDPGLVVVSPPASMVAPGGDPADDLVHLSLALAREYRVGVTLHDPSTGALVATLREPDYIGTPSPDTPRTLDLTVPASVASGTYQLRIQLPADPARGRSVRTYQLTVTRS